jgi:SAM-dependent methyltransferase
MMISQEQPSIQVEKRSAAGSVKVCPICGSDGPALRLRAPDRFHMRKDYYRLLECRSCSFVWLDDMPAPEEMPYHYGVDYHRAVTASGEVKLLLRWGPTRDTVMKLGRPGALLDVGCSSGPFLRTLRDGPWKLYGLEISPDEAKTAEASSGAEVFVGTVLDAPFPDESFEVITACHFLEHAHELREVVRTMWRWLKPGGILYIQVPNIESFESYIFKSYWYGLELPRHLWHFSPASLRELLRPAGFEEVYVRTTPDCYVQKSVRYLLDEASGKAGISRTPLAEMNGAASIPRRLVRKAAKVGFLTPFSHASAALGYGSAIETVFRKKPL